MKASNLCLVWPGYKICAFQNRSLISVEIVLKEDVQLVRVDSSSNSLGTSIAVTISKLLLLHKGEKLQDQIIVIVCA